MREISAASGSRHPIVCAAFCALGLGACAAGEASLDDGPPMAGQDPLALQAPASQQTIPDPNGAYFAEVRANGTGCPAGTWHTAIAPDGLVFTTYFNAYYVNVDEQTQYELRDCTLAIKLHSPSGLSYTISDFYYEGYAWLDEGVQGRQVASYSFQGMPTRATEMQTDLSGPYDDPFSIHHAVETKNLAWSPCGVERTLNVKTVLRMTNSTPRRSGYMNVSEVNGDTKTKMVFKLHHKQCSTSASDGANNTVGGSSGDNRPVRGR